MSFPAGTRSFEATLAAVLRERGAGEPTLRFATRLATTAFVLEGGPGGAFASAANAAFDEYAIEPPEAPPTLPSDEVADIAEELALSQRRDRSALQSLRRRFMWDNHPDRRPDLPRGLANRRVAIANMLIDRALR